jgi:hypothetical protein
MAPITETLISCRDTRSSFRRDRVKITHKQLMTFLFLFLRSSKIFGRKRKKCHMVDINLSDPVKHTLRYIRTNGDLIL